MIDMEIKIMAITETWLKEGDDAILTELCPQGFSPFVQNRPSDMGHRGGGLAFLVSDEITVNAIPNEAHDTFESLVIRICGKKPVLLALIYRPPPNARNKFTPANFLHEFEEFATSMFLQHSTDMIILGDFNLHWNHPTETHVRAFGQILDTLDMTQKVNGPTHVNGNTIDLVISDSGASDRVSNVCVRDVALSDHFLITLTLEADKTPPKRNKRKCRKLRRMDMEAFTSTLSRNMTDIGDECLNSGQLDGLVAEYEQAVTKSLDSHAPLREITLKGETLKPWYDEDIHSERRKRRQLERRYKKTSLVVHKELLKEQSDRVVSLIKEKKANYYQEQLREADQKGIFKLVKTLIKPSTRSEGPCGDAKHQANEFQSFFENKVKKIHEKMGSITASNNNDDPFAASSFSQFKAMSQEEVADLMKKAPNKSCSLDPLPTALLKHDNVLPIVLPTITKIINLSFIHCYVPHDYKIANVKPRIKKEGADATELTNYRPVSNLQFASKVLEKAVCTQLEHYLEEYGIMDPLQSAYRKHHSTETAMIKVKEDIDTTLDRGNAVLLVLLDLSAAFDTLDHQIMLNRLEKTVGIRGDALRWVKSYLQDRFQRVVVDESQSPCSALITGVPQGSVLGPLLFSLYVLPLQKLIEKHGISRHHYADDSQLYKELHINNQPNNQLQDDVKAMEDCIEDVRIWMLQNKLKLNEKKTEVIIMSTKNNKQRLSNVTLKVGDDEITPKENVRDLGCWLDDRMTMQTQVKNTVRASYYHLRNINRIRRNLDDEACAKVINATVTSRLDYHNALISGSHQCIMKKMQLLQNHSARVLTRTNKRDHISPVLRQLHWLPVKERCDFKLLTMVHSALHKADAPQYIKAMFHLYVAPRPLRSCDDQWTLTVSSSHRHEGERCASHRGAILWNTLPADMRYEPALKAFKKKLKTYLFML